MVITVQLPCFKVQFNFNSNIKFDPIKRKFGLKFLQKNLTDNLLFTLIITINLKMINYFIRKNTYFWMNEITSIQNQIFLLTKMYILFEEMILEKKEV